MFIISLQAVRSEEFCAFVGGLLHYFMLVTFFLMGAEAINLYLKLVVVLGIPPILKNRYVLKATLIAWSKSHIRLLRLVLIFVCFIIVTPFFIVVASEAPNWRNYVREYL